MGGREKEERERREIVRVKQKRRIWKNKCALGQDAGIMWDKMIRAKEVRKEERGNQVLSKDNEERKKENRYVTRKKQRNKGEERERWREDTQEEIRGKQKIKGRSICKQIIRLPSESGNIIGCVSTDREQSKDERRQAWGMSSEINGVMTRHKEVCYDLAKGKEEGADNSAGTIVCV